jgi:integrase
MGSNMKLTDAAVTKLELPEGKADHIEWDDTMPGFGVRLRRGSKRVSGVIQYRIGSQQRRESLGDLRKIGVEAARKIARQRFAQVELGQDPVQERAEARAQATARKLTLALVADRYLDAKKDVMRASTYSQNVRYFSQHWEPLRGFPISAITRADIAARLQEIVKQRGRSAAACARRKLSALFGWAMREGLVDSNPTLLTNDPEEGLLSRDRVLSDAEIALVWRACGDDIQGRIIKMLLLLGCRRHEVGGLRWDEIDLETGMLTIPGSRTKNGRALELTLSPVALELAADMPRAREYVFGRGAFSGWSVLKMRLDLQITTANGRALAPWRLHDLRRTMRSGLGRLGVPPHVAELCINHVRGGVQGIYDKHKYQNEIAAALALWAEHVLAVAEGRQQKVIALRA